MGDAAPDQLGRLPERHEIALLSAQHKILAALRQEHRVQQAWQEYQRERSLTSCKETDQATKKEASLEQQDLNKELSHLIFEAYHALVTGPKMIDETSLHSSHHGPNIAAWIQMLQHAFESTRAPSPQDSDISYQFDISNLMGTPDHLDAIGPHLELKALHSTLLYSNMTIARRLMWHFESADPNT
ncbi:hypothetical protein M8542_07840 [Amycolatopsis sp. OK19-0408]|uniref:Uncharacterized protein n=1 Tax=Amycolatopsis iheyensis TaxID=2945988 RepID=A0A9X2SJV0_9PSEU|nr:hypothetical protein [Amycolatopsis iheyensis]MCR6482725.1 hypothetical protein [Amycolatopsis iheyensis]